MHYAHYLQFLCIVGKQTTRLNGLEGLGDGDRLKNTGVIPELLILSEASWRRRSRRIVVAF